MFWNDIRAGLTVIILAGLSVIIIFATTLFIVPSSLSLGFYLMNKLVPALAPTCEVKK